MDCIKNPSYAGKCPDKMSDGRNFTDYRANTHIYSDIRYKKGIVSGYDYREYLTQNAVKLMNDNSKKAWHVNGCGPCKNLCLGIDDSKRAGNSTEFNTTSCIPPASYYDFSGLSATNSNSNSKYPFPNNK